MDNSTPQSLLQMPQAHNSVGINQSGIPMNQSPKSNPGVVYQPANKPTNPGALKVAQQAGGNIYYLGKDGSKMVLGNNDVDVPDQTVQIVIYAADGTITAVFGGGIIDSGRVVATSTTGTSALIAVNQDGGYAGFFSDGNSGTDNVVHIEIFNVSNTNSPLQIANAHTYNTHFKKMENLQTVSAGVTIWTSDGNTPNAVLTGNQGDICLNSSGTGQIAYNNNGSTGWTLL